jgi:hypothetical protein
MLLSIPCLALVVWCGRIRKETDMDQVDPGLVALSVLGFALTGDDQFRKDAVLEELDHRLGERRSVFIRTDALGQGRTLVRDRNGRRWWSICQYDLSKYYTELSRYCTRKGG